MMMRLDKYLAEMNLGSRNQIREAAKKGRVTVNGSVEKQADRKVNPESDKVTFDGRTVSYTAFEYYMLNKPQNVVSAREDKLHKTVVQLLSEGRRDLFPVGRLDIDTEGLLLLTNDGDLAHRLLTPKKHIDKVYYAKVEGILPEDAVRRMEEGLTLSDQFTALPAGLLILSEGAEETEIQLTIREGKFHQVKRMFEALDCRVSYLKRMSMGSLQLDGELEPGEYRPLTPKELQCLKDECGC